MTKLAPEWVRTSDPVIRSPARYRWTTAPALPVGSIKASEMLIHLWKIIAKLSRYIDLAKSL